MSADRIFPVFIVEQMPPGIAGLMIAAILAAAMSNLSAALNSLASTSVVDFYLPRYPEISEQLRTRLSRLMTVVWAAILFALAMFSRGGGHVVEIGLSIASVLWGACWASSCSVRSAVAPVNAVPFSAWRSRSSSICCSGSSRMPCPSPLLDTLSSCLKLPGPGGSSSARSSPAPSASPQAGSFPNTTPQHEELYEV